MGEVCACGIWASIGHEGAEVREMIGGELTAALGGQNFSDLRAQRQELRSTLEETLNREGPMVYHVIINYDVAEYHA